MENFSAHSLPAVLVGAIKLALMVSLLQASRLWHRGAYLWPLVVGLVLAGSGLLFKVEHWPGADALLLTGASLVALTYGLWFETNASPSLLDFLKLAWLISACASIVALSLYKPALRPLAGLTEGLFWAMGLRYGFQRWIRRPAQVLE